MEKEFIITSLAQLQKVAEEISVMIDKDNVDILLLRGTMGAGKTTFSKELCRARGVEDTVTSPTFALINEYRDKLDDSIYHFDFYRIDNIKEVMDLGYEEYFYSGSLCLIEWAENIEELIPQSGEGVVVGTIKLEQMGGKEERKITYSV